MTVAMPKVLAKATYDASRPHCVFPCFHAGFGDWVLVNRIAAYVKRRDPVSMLVMAVPAEGNPRTFLRDLAMRNVWVDAVCEVPCPEVTGDLAAGGHGTAQADAVLSAWLKGLCSVRVYRYSEYPQLAAFANSVDAKIAAQRVYDLDKAIIDDGYLETFRPSEEACAKVDRIIAPYAGAMTVVAHAKIAEDAAQFSRVFASLAAQMPLIVFGVGGEGAVFCDEPWYVRLSAEECSLDMLTALLLRADLFAGNISGPMHLASAMGTTIVAYYFPEWTMIDWSPRQPKPFYDVVYKRAVGFDGAYIDDVRAYGISNAHVARFEPVGDERLYESVTRMLRKRRWSRGV